MKILKELRKEKHDLEANIQLTIDNANLNFNVKKFEDKKAT